MCYMTHSFSYMAHPEKTSARQSRASNDAMSNAKPVLTARGLRSAQLVGQAGGGEGRPHPPRPRRGPPQHLRRGPRQGLPRGGEEAVGGNWLKLTDLA